MIDPDGTTHTTEIQDAVTESDITRRGWNRVRVGAKGRHYQFFIHGKFAPEFTDNATEQRLDKGRHRPARSRTRGMRVDFKGLRLKKTGSAK